VRARVALCDGTTNWRDDWEGARVGPLHGVKVIELTGIGPGPFAGTLLSDMGAEVVRVERAQLATSASRPSGFVFDGRGRRAITVDLKHADGVETVLRMVEQADALIEGYRPGVTERLGLGPDVCLARNPRLVYGRMTGWGQDGPLAHAAGHDINYISLAGALAHFGRVGQPPTPPINLVGDYGGGGMFLAFGVVCGILEARTSGQGQVVDAAMVDGAAYLMGAIWGLRGLGMFEEDRGTNLLDTGSPFYDVYETADGEWVSIGSIEPQFFAQLLELTGIETDDLPHQMDRSGWPRLRERLTATMKAKTRAEWVDVLEGTDVCFAPVLPMSEAKQHPHVVARGIVVEHDDIDQPAPAPRFSRTPPEIQGRAPLPGEHSESVLADFGFGSDEVERLLASGAVTRRS
jgi:alpha-methylacyl-CoA racemase